MYFKIDVSEHVLSLAHGFPIIGIFGPRQSGKTTLAITVQPYYNNLGKRIVKSPKLYFCDTGALCRLLDINDKNTLLKNNNYGKKIKVLMKIVFEREVYGHLSGLSRCLHRLEYSGFIKSFLYGNNWKVVFITKKGAESLALESGIPIKDISIPNLSHKVGFATLEHTVKIANLYLELAMEIPEFPEFCLKEWLGDQQVFLQYRFRSVRNGKTIRRNLAPDSFFLLHKNGVDLPYFLEYDTGTMDREQLVQKFMRCFEYFVYGEWRERFETFPSILFLSSRKEQAMKKYLQEPEVPLEKALALRSKFSDSTNIVWKAIGMSENIKSINSNLLLVFNFSVMILFNTLVFPP